MSHHKLLHIACRPTLVAQPICATCYVGTLWSLIAIKKAEQTKTIETSSPFHWPLNVVFLYQKPVVINVKLH